ncbi:hypothetical protein L3X38_040688 [Prunus dulcis]|uniref:Uncharacterized protein n=1 Tax=Prunus dulcis TaxID=3755 RepID=A0AAD4YTM4_PRUDU|nr:hypothetical protein L3X38_040688 [Prunus dulcis]
MIVPSKTIFTFAEEVDNFNPQLQGHVSVHFVGQVMHITKYEIRYLDFADRSVTYPEGIIEDVLIKVKKFVFPVDFFVLDMEEDHDTSHSC